LANALKYYRIARIQSLEGSEKERLLADGGDLYLRLRKSGEDWLFIYRFRGTQRKLGLGAYPDLGLAKARTMAESARKLLVEAKDPRAERLAQLAEERATADQPPDSDAAWCGYAVGDWAYLAMEETTRSLQRRTRSVAARIDLFALPLRDPRTGKWIRARYVARREQIAERYAGWEITGPAEIRDVDPDARAFSPFKQTMDAELRRDSERPPELQPTIDAVEAFLLAVFLRRYVTYCARRGRFAAMNGAVRLFAEV
jgi:hypothetical protein